VQAIELLDAVTGAQTRTTILRGRVARDFVEQPLQREYGNELLLSAQTLIADADRYQQTLTALGDLYCQGYQLDWHTVYGEAAPKRVRLPTYPFAREKYWLEKLPERSSSNAMQLHPLLHANTSDLVEQRFTTVLSGTESVVLDHVVGGERVLAGVCALEMARA